METACPRAKQLTFKPTISSKKSNTPNHPAQEASFYNSTREKLPLPFARMTPSKNPYGKPRRKFESTLAHRQDEDRKASPGVERYREIDGPTFSRLETSAKAARRKLMYDSSDDDDEGQSMEDAIDKNLKKQEEKEKEREKEREEEEEGKGEEEEEKYWERLLTARLKHMERHLTHVDLNAKEHPEAKARVVKDSHTETPTSKDEPRTPETLRAMDKTGELKALNREMLKQSIGRGREKPGLNLPGEERSLENGDLFPARARPATHSLAFDDSDWQVKLSGSLRDTLERQQKEKEEENHKRQLKLMVERQSKLIDSLATTRGDESTCAEREAASMAAMARNRVVLNRLRSMLDGGDALPAHSDIKDTPSQDSPPRDAPPAHTTSGDTPCEEPSPFAIPRDDTTSAHHPPGPSAPKTPRHIEQDDSWVTGMEMQTIVFMG